MTERVQKKTSPSKKAQPEVEVQEPAQSAQAEKLKTELDELLDEIDSVLEENAEEFVNAYVQKGGQVNEVMRSLWGRIKGGFQLLPPLPQFKWTGI